MLLLLRIPIVHGRDVVLVISVTFVVFALDARWAHQYRDVLLVLRRNRLHRGRCRATMMLVLHGPYYTRTVNEVVLVLDRGRR